MLVWVASCGRHVTGTPETAEPTLLYTASPIAEPLPTPTFSQIDRLFTLPTEGPILFGVPAPVILPLPAPPGSRGLRPLSEQQSFELLQETAVDASENYPPGADRYDEARYVASQRPVALAIQEYLYRFPDSDDADRLKWQLAFINAIMDDELPGNPYGVAWMARELGRRLNEGEAPPYAIEGILDQYWFNAVISRIVEDLFGAGTMGWVYQIVPQIWFDDSFDTFRGGLFIAIHETQPQRYEVIVLKQAWNFIFGTSHVFDISDHNRNGIPEIALEIGSHSGTMCGGRLLVYEWQESSFMELTDGAIRYRDCTEFFEYTEYEGTPAVIYPGLFPAVRREVYLWDGERYRYSHLADATPLQSWRIYSETNRLGYENDPAILQEALESGEAEEYGAAYPDYLRLRLGIAYALYSRPEPARHTLQGLIERSVDSTRPMLPDLARTFLADYSGDASLYAACREVNRTYNGILEPYRRYGSDAEADEAFKDHFNFPLSRFELYVPHLCDEQAALSLAVGTLRAGGEDFPEALRSIGVVPDALERVDVDLDGITEWVLVIGGDRAYLTYEDGLTYRITEIPAWLASDFAPQTFQVSLEAWQGFPDTILAVRSGEELSIVRAEDRFEMVELFDDFAVRSFQSLEQEASPQFLVYYLEPASEEIYFHPPLLGFRWDEDRNSFQPDLLEYALFTQQDPKKAAQIAQEFLPLLEEWKDYGEYSRDLLAYEYYLAGLSYELSGDLEGAAEIYMQLWSRYPGSPYARMAKYKLEASQNQCKEGSRLEQSGDPR